MASVRSKAHAVGREPRGGSGGHEVSVSVSRQGPACLVTVQHSHPRALLARHGPSCALTLACVGATSAPSPPAGAGTIADACGRVHCCVRAKRSMMRVCAQADHRDVVSHTSSSVMSYPSPTLLAMRVDSPSSVHGARSSAVAQTPCAVMARKCTPR